VWVAALALSFLLPASSAWRSTPVLARLAGAADPAIAAADASGAPSMLAAWLRPSPGVERSLPVSTGVAAVLLASYAAFVCYRAARFWRSWRRTVEIRRA